MEQTYTYRQKISQFSRILFPIFVTQLGLFAMNFFDVVMSGNVSPTDLAGVAIGANLWVPIFVGLSGILMSITPIVSQLFGAKKEESIPDRVLQGIYVSLMLAITIMLLGALVLDPVLNHMNIEEDVRYIAKGYLVALRMGSSPYSFILFYAAILMP